MHVMEKIEEILRTITLKGQYKMYEDTRLQYIFACACGYEEKFSRLPWDTLLFETYKTEGEKKCNK